MALREEGAIFISGEHMNNEAYVIPVSDRIKDLVIKFINSVLTTESREFTSGQLRSYVNLATDNQVAPGSPDRILRDLRAKGKVNYYVVNRGKSLYKALPVATPNAFGGHTTV